MRFIEPSLRNSNKALREANPVEVPVRAADQILTFNTPLATAAPILYRQLGEPERDRCRYGQAQS